MTTGCSPSPLELTQQVLDISVTERADFKSCRRRWYLGTILNLQPRAMDELAFAFGTGIHSALEAYYKSTAKTERTRQQRAFSAFKKWVDVTKDAAPNNDVFAEVLEHAVLGDAMLENYFEFDQTAKVQLGTPVAVEGEVLQQVFKQRLLVPRRPDGYSHSADPVRHPSGRLLVPIVDPFTKEPLHDRPMLSMRLDLITERKTPKLGLWIDDHKTSSSVPSDRGIDFDDQVTGYCYGLWRWLGIIPRGAVMNYLIKEVPKEPRIVNARGKKGELTLSYAKDQLTTPRLYREALKEWGFMSGSRINSEPHGECLDALLARGWSPFFQRLEVTRNEHELYGFERHLVEEYADMRESKALEHRRYPNRSRWHCPSCQVNKICLAMEDGSDADHIAETQYVQAPDRKAV